jgi:hypothetical protein
MAAFLPAPAPIGTPPQLSAAYEDSAGTSTATEGLAIDVSIEAYPMADAEEIAWRRARREPKRAGKH